MIDNKKQYVTRPVHRVTAADAGAGLSNALLSAKPVCIKALFSVYLSVAITGNRHSD
ncbi:MAG: hypothetical protein AABZ67_14110 [Pseudomonadota bacterium]